jgi:hypothetical protein
MEDTRVIIPAKEEAEQLDTLAGREKDLLFLQQWRLVEDYPACPTGITLLREFAEAYPSLYWDFVAKNPRGHQTLPALGRNAKWIEYRHHWGTCADCMEV